MLRLIGIPPMVSQTIVDASFTESQTKEMGHRKLFIYVFFPLCEAEVHKG